MTPAQSWDAVLSIQHDIERIVSQAVRGGRVSSNDSEDCVNSAMVASVALAERYDGTIEQFRQYALATLRRELKFDPAHRTDAMDRVVETENADISANRVKGGFKPARAISQEKPNLGCLTPLENRVARLLAAGNPIGQIAKKLGTTVRGVKTVAGMAEAKIRRTEKTGSAKESTS